MASQGWMFGGGAILAGLALDHLLIPAQINLAAGQAGEMSPAFFPSLVAQLMIAIGLIELARLGIVRWAGLPRASPRETPDSPAGACWGTAGMLLLLVLWPLAAAQLGFAVALFLALLAIQMLLDEFTSRIRPQAVLIAVAGTLAIFGLFEWLLGVPLPRGRLW